MLNRIDSLNNSARIWVYAFNRPLTENEAAIVQDAFRQFVGNWQSHGKPVRGAFQLLYDRFVILAAEEEDISGCSIDGSVGVFKQLFAMHGLDALDASQIFYRKGERIESVSRAEFRELLETGMIDGECRVFDLSISRMEELRAGMLEKRLADSWHGQAFSRALAG